MTDRELMQRALEALERYGGVDQRACDAEEALRERLAQPEQEPIAWVYQEGLEALKSAKPWVVYGCDGNGAYPDGVERTPLYLAPRQWQGLTDEEIAEIAATPAAIPGAYVHSFARAIETRLKEKNCG